MVLQPIGMINAEGKIIKNYTAKIISFSWTFVYDMTLYVFLSVLLRTSFNPLIIDQIQSPTGQ